MCRTYSIFIIRSLLGVFMLPALLCLGISVRAQAETLQKYRENIESVKADLFYLYAVGGSDLNKEWTKYDQVQAQNKFFEKAAALLPAQQTIEWKNIKIETDNRWLQEEFAAIKRLPADSKDRNKIVDEIDGRLSALVSKIKELEAQQPGTGNKDEEKQKLDKILKRPEYQPQKDDPKEESTMQRWSRVFLDWFRDLLPKSEQTEQPREMESPGVRGGPGISPIVVQVLVIGLVIAVLAFVIWRVAPLLRGRAGRKKEKREKEERIILGERLAADESSSTLFDQAEQMAREGNFRGAIRKGYVALLCELGDRKIVRIAQNKTNRDYLNDVRKHQALHTGVRDLTFMFENHWYGLAAASEEEWSAFRENYRHSTSAF
jgi:hypothetical protein